MDQREQAERESRVWGMHYARLQEAKKKQDEYMEERYREYIFRTIRNKNDIHAKGDF